MSRRKRKARRRAGDPRRDAYARKAREAGYRSRAVYKIEQIDRQDRLFRGVRRVLDLGAAPGGWSQFARKAAPAATVVAVDVLPMSPVEGVTFIQGDFSDAAVRDRIVKQVAPDRYDLVISDMAPNITGIPDVDQARSAELVEQVITFSSRVMAQNGKFLVKVFEGSEAERIRALARSVFRHCAVRKPGASRDKSREFYLVSRQPRG